MHKGIAYNYVAHKILIIEKLNRKIHAQILWRKP